MVLMVKMMVWTIFSAKKATLASVWKFKALQNQRSTCRGAQKYASCRHNYSQRIDSRRKPSFVKCFCAQALLVVFCGESWIVGLSLIKNLQSHQSIVLCFHKNAKNEANLCKKGFENFFQESENVFFKGSESCSSCGRTILQTVVLSSDTNQWRFSEVENRQVASVGLFEATKSTRFCHNFLLCFQNEEENCWI